MKWVLSLLMIAFTLGSVAAQIDWEDPIDIASSSSGNNHPRIVTDASGNPVVIWYHANRVMLSRWNGISFTMPKIVNPVSMNVAGASWMGPDIAAHGDTIYVVYKQTPEDVGKSWIMTSFDGGASFSQPVQVDFIGDSLSRFPTVTTDASGNPVVAFMKFNSTFGDARWAVSRSDDYGQTFNPDVLASGWSSATSEVCDCCPGSIVGSGENIAMTYRDNNDNIRDTWSAFSTDGGATFSKGTNIDIHNWEIHSCPASGPDAVIVGDTLYSIFMNGAGGKNRVYYNRTSVANINSQQSMPVTGDIEGLGQQNFPRIASYGKAVGMVWKQLVSGDDQLVINFSNDITSGLPFVYDTVDLDKIFNADVSMFDNKIFVVWEDYASGTVKFRSGTYEIRTRVDEAVEGVPFKIYPNPSDKGWKADVHLKAGTKVELFSLRGRVEWVRVLEEDVEELEIGNGELEEGVYILVINQGLRRSVVKVVKI